MKAFLFTTFLMLGVTNSSATEALELKDLREGRYEWASIGCVPYGHTDQYIWIENQGKKYTNIDSACDIVGRTDTGEYKLECVDLDEGFKSAYSMPIDVKSKVTFKLYDVIWRWCATWPSQ